MIALLSSIFSLWKRPSRKTLSTYEKNVPQPLEVHQVLHEDFLKDFKEVFVIGDVHGCYNELIELLNKAEVTDDTSLKIFVGDVVRKGPKSPEVLHLIKDSKSMLTVRGKQEDIVLRECSDDDIITIFYMHPIDNWIKTLSKEDFNYLKQLPYTISIPSLNAIVVHGGVLPGIPLYRNNPSDLATMKNLIVNDYFGDGGIQTTKSTDEGYGWASLWPGPEHVYFGHDAKRLLQQEQYATGLDTACVYGQFLTGIFISGPKAGTLVQVKAKRHYAATAKFRRVKCYPIMYHKEEENPFSKLSRLERLSIATWSYFSGIYSFCISKLNDGQEAYNRPFEYF